MSLSLALKSTVGVLIVVVIALAQTLPYYHAPALAAEALIQPQHAIVEQETVTDNWPTYHRDNLRSGYDPNIPQFASANPSPSWTPTQLDGAVYAEPLVVGGDLIVATEANSLYELNANTGEIIWQTNFGTPVTSGLYCSGDINPSGITSTPVIDVTAGTIFVVAFLQGPPLHHELFAVNLATGMTEFSVGVDPSSSNFPVNAQQQRAALALANGYVYVGYGGLDGDCGPYHGWVVATDENGEGPLITYQVPTGVEGGIWGGGDGPAVDASGNIWVATGNSDATSTFDYGDAVLELSSATATPPLSLLQYFAPTNWASLNSGDVDLGSTEPVFLSPNYVFQVGKEGVGYILSASTLGGIGGQLYSADVCNGGGAYGGLAYSAPYLIVPCDNGLVALNVNLSSKSPSWTVAWTGPDYVTGPPIIAGNAVWDVDTSDGLIYAFSLTSGQTLFSYSIGSVPTHFNSLSAGDGQIFVPANTEVLAFTPQPATTSTPTTSTTSTATVTSSLTTTDSTSTTTSLPSTFTATSTLPATTLSPTVTKTASTTTTMTGTGARTSTTTFTSILTTATGTSTATISTGRTIVLTATTTGTASATSTSSITTVSTTTVAGTVTVSQTNTFTVFLNKIIRALLKFANEVLRLVGTRTVARPKGQKVIRIIVTKT